MKNRKGFTLIELLAVITIMGILMLVAIPAVSRTIENSRRDAYVDVVKTYINTVRNAVLADELECKLSDADGATPTSVGATPNGTYYFKLSTFDGDTETQQTKDIMESGGLSSWSNANVKGYIKWIKQARTEGETGDLKTTTSYSALLVDAGKHGLDTETAEMSITRQKIKTSATIDPTAENAISYPDGTAKECTLK